MRRTIRVLYYNMYVCRIGRVVLFIYFLIRLVTCRLNQNAVSGEMNNSLCEKCEKNEWGHVWSCCLRLEMIIFVCA